MRPHRDSNARRSQGRESPERVSWKSYVKTFGNLLGNFTNNTAGPDIDFRRFFKSLHLEGKKL